MRIKPSAILATRVDPQTALAFCESMAWVSSTPSESIRLMIGAALAGPWIVLPANAPAPASAATSAEAA